MDWQATVFWPALHPLFIQLIRTPPANRDATVISRAESLSLAATQILDAYVFHDRAFLNGESFSMGDIPARDDCSSLSLRAQIFIIPNCPNLYRWYQHCIKQRSPFRAVVMTPLS